MVHRTAIHGGMMMQIRNLTETTALRSATARCGEMRKGCASSHGPIASLSVGIIVLALILLPECVAAREKTAYLRPSNSASSALRGAPAQSASVAQSENAGGHHRAYFGSAHASREVHNLADWIVDSADNRDLSFVIVDKIDAKVFAFDAGGRILGAAPALLGLARGDDTVPGIGDRELSDQPPETRTTPAGRFVAALGMDSHGQDVVWVDYEAAVALHRVITTNPEERRLERLATPTPLDNRISWGCINVPTRFYETVIKPAFIGTGGIVYVLPETRPTREVFGSYNVEERLGRTDPARTEPTKQVSK